MTAVAAYNSVLLLGVFVLLAYATGKRPGPITAALVLSLAVSIASFAVVPRAEQLAAVLAIDAGLVAFMAFLARTAPPQIAETARIIMAIGTLKIVFAIAAVLLELDHNARAAGRNGAFVVQIIVAGGMADGIIAWLGHRARGLGDRARRVLHRVGVK